MKQGVENSRKRAETLQPNVFERVLNQVRRAVNYIIGSEYFHTNTIGIEVKYIEKITERLKAKDDVLVDYIKAVFKELVTNLNTTAGLLQDDKNNDLKKRIIGIEWTSDEKSKTTFDYMHHFSGYPLPSLGMILEMYEREGKETSPKTEREKNANNEGKAVMNNESEALRKIKDIYKKMRSIEQIINSPRYMIIANPQEKRMYQKRLETQKRVPLPNQDLPVKLVNRIKMLQYYYEGVTSNTPNWLIIRSNDEPIVLEKLVREMRYMFGPKLIARSMFRGEDSLLPMAGFFDSGVFESIEGYNAAVEKIRAMGSRHLAQFCLHRGFQQPSQDDMFIGIEPYHDTTYLGSIVEHPNHNGVYLIEFGQRCVGNPDLGSNWIEAKQILYDANNDNVLNSHEPLLSVRNINFIKLSKKLAEIYKNMVNETVGEVSCSQQMEFGFDLGITGMDDYLILCYQIRGFRQKTSQKDFKITKPLETTSVMGTTEQEGIECVVIDTNDPIELGVLTEKARAQGYGIMYLSHPREEMSNVREETGEEGSERFVKYDDVAVASLIPDVDVLVLGKSLKVMSHMYFNAMVNAKNVVLLEEGQLSKLPEQGTVVNYACNGTDCSIRKINTSEKIKYQIREALNK